MNGNDDDDEQLLKLQCEIAAMEAELGREVPLGDGDGDAATTTITLKDRAAAAAVFTGRGDNEDEGDDDELRVPGSGRVVRFSLPDRVLAYDGQRMVFDSAVIIPQPPSTDLPDKVTTVEFSPWFKARPKETSGWRRNQVVHFSSVQCISFMQTRRME